MSYSLYLWHWPVFVFLFHHVDEGHVGYSLLGISISLALSWATLKGLENPIRFNRTLSSGLLRTYVTGAALTAGVAGLALGIWLIAEKNLSSPEQRIFLAAGEDSPYTYSDGCHLAPLDTELLECAYGDRDGKLNVVLFGDSHAAHWFPALHQLANDNSWKLVSMTKSACSSVINEPFSTILNRTYSECITWRENAINKLAALRPELLILSNSRLSSTDTDWQTSLESMLARVSELATQVVVVRDVPRPIHSVPECLSRAHWLGRDLEKSCRVAVPPPTEDRRFTAETSAVAGFANAALIDMTDAICASSSCPAYTGGVVKYKDDHHLSNAFSLSLSPALRTALEPYLR